MRIPRIVRDLQVERESLFLDFSSQRLFHGLNLFFCSVASAAFLPHFAGNYPRLSHNGFVSIFLCKEPVYSRPLLYISLIAVFERARLQSCRKGEVLSGV